MEKITYPAEIVFHKDCHLIVIRKMNQLFTDPEKTSRYDVEDYGNSLLASGIADDCTDFSIRGLSDILQSELKVRS